MSNTLPADSDERNGVPLNDGFFRYFPAAIAGAARWSKLGNDKHNPGQPLHWARSKSTDHGNKILRHLMDINDYLAEAERECHLDKASVKALLEDADALVWRSAALSQVLHERFAGAPMAPAAVVDNHPEGDVDVRENSIPDRASCGGSGEAGFSQQLSAGFRSLDRWRNNE